MIKAIGNTCIVEVDVSKEELLKSGIVVIKKKPNQFSSDAISGEVISVGAGKVLRNGDILPFSVKEGDVVVFKIAAMEEIPCKDLEKIFKVPKDKVYGKLREVDVGFLRYLVHQIIPVWYSVH